MEETGERNSVCTDYCVTNEVEQMNRIKIILVAKTQENVGSFIKADFFLWLLF